MWRMSEWVWTVGCVREWRRDEEWVRCGVKRESGCV